MNAWIAGVGEAAPPTRDRRPDTLALGVTAARRALDDAGIAPSAVDGVLAYGLYGDIVPAEAIGFGLGCRTLRAAYDLAMGGQAPAMLIGLARQLVLSGQAEVVVITRALRNGISVGSAVVPRLDGSLRLSAGMSAYPVAASLWARTYLQRAGLPDEALAEAPLHATRRAWGADAATLSSPPEDFRARALPHSLPEYLDTPMIATPLRRGDCVSEIDGAAAIVVASDAAARDSTGAMRVAGSVWRSVDADVDMSSMLAHDDLSRNVAWDLHDGLRRELGIDPASADIVSIYDCFSSVLLQTIEGLGLCGFGEAPQYLAGRGHDAATGPVVNPGGGMLARGYLHGMINAIDAVRAARLLRASQTDASALVVSGGMTSGSAVLLET